MQAKLEEIANQMAWSQSQQLATLEKNSISQENVKPKRQSFLKRMWNSLKANDEADMPQSKSSKFSDSMPPSINEGNVDIQDKPSFTRKD